MKTLSSPQKARLLLQIGLAFVFLYAAVASLLHPDQWIGFLPDFVKTILPEQTALTLFSVYELGLAAWLISGWKLMYSSLLAALTLLVITLVSLSVFAITFRDVGLVLAAGALYFLSTDK